MATATKTKPADTTGIVPYRITVRQFEKMIDAAVFPDDQRIELIGGSLVAKMTKNDPHDNAVIKLAHLLRGFLPEGWYVREEKSVVLGPYDRPEPDLAVARGNEMNLGRAPRPKDLALLVEVTDQTYAKDRGPKFGRYASARVPCYWIVNLSKKQVEVYRDPKGRGAGAHYASVETFAASADLPVVIDGHALGRIAVRALLS